MLAKDSSMIGSPQLRRNSFWKSSFASSSASGRCRQRASIDRARTSSSGSRACGCPNRCASSLSRVVSTRATVPLLHSCLKGDTCSLTQTSSRMTRWCVPAPERRACSAATAGWTSRIRLSSSGMPSAPASSCSFASAVASWPKRSQKTPSAKKACTSASSASHVASVVLPRPAVPQSPVGAMARVACGAPRRALRTEPSTSGRGS